MASSGCGLRSLSDVQTGMRVTDRDNELIGTVTAVRMGDPGALTSPRRRQQAGLLEGVTETVPGAAPTVPPKRAEQLLRTGYVKIDAMGSLIADLFAGADEIGTVDGNLVRLSVPRQHLIPES